MKFIADEKIIYRSPDARSIYCYTPAIAEGFDGRLIAGVDLGGPGTEALEGPRSSGGDYPCGNQVRILLSDDEGKSWRESPVYLPMRHEILFRAGKKLYAMGNAPDLVISSSSDNGESWSDPVVLCEAEKRTWHQSSTLPVIRNNRVYLVQEQFKNPLPMWPNVNQIMMSGDVDSDLCKKENWRFSNPFVSDPVCDGYRDLCDLMPDYNPGILETHVLPISPDCGHLYTPGENSFLLCSRFNTPGFQQGVIFKGVEHSNGELEITFFPGRTPGVPLFVVPFPGAALKFHILFDEESQLYFLAANQPRSVFEGEYNGSRSNRRHLVLWCARDGVSFNFLGHIACGEDENASRNYPQMIIRGEDLLVISRSGDREAKNRHDTNLVTLHRVKNFRELARENMV